MDTFVALRDQVMRFGIVGVLNNLSGYLIYLFLTWIGVPPKLTITLLYPVGAAMGYYGHAKYSFTYDGGAAYSAARYVVAHLIGYIVNFSMLYIFADRLAFHHQVVQAAAIFVVGGALFLLFRYYVFPKAG